MDLKATLKEATSKSGKPYTYLSIQITDTIEKKVFLDPAEIELINLTKKDVKPSNNIFGK